ELLLADIRDVFDGLVRDKDRISSEYLIDQLVEIVPRPWAEYGRTGKPLSQNGLARLLKPLAITPQTIRVSDDTAKGYYRHQFEEAWDRFLAKSPESQPSHRNKCDEMGTSTTFTTVTTQNPVTVAESQKSNNHGLCYGVTVGSGETPRRARVHTQKSKSDDLLYHGQKTEIPDLGPDPLDEHGAQVCAYCGQPGGHEVAVGNTGTVRLHPGCEQPWIAKK